MWRSGASRAILCAAGWITFGVAVGLAAAPGSNLYLNGALASRQVFQHNGAACVPVADVARALGKSVVRKSDGYALAPASGAHQARTLTSRVGDPLTDSQLTLEILKVTKPLSTLNQPGDEIVVVYRLKKARPRPRPGRPQHRADGPTRPHPRPDEF